MTWLTGQVNLDCRLKDLEVKAFDTVPHQRLLTKLKAYGVHGSVHAWINSFLSQRKQRVVVNGACSQWNDVTSGIPQGSVLGPTLFIIYINDLPETVESMVHIFADDTKIYRKIATENDCVKLKKDLDILQEWSSKWLLSFNAKKCKVMRLGGQHPDFIYKMINNTPVNMQVSLRYRHLPDLYRTYRIPFAHTGLVPFQYLHTSTGTIPANTFVDQCRFTIRIVVPAIYRQISSGPVSSYRYP